MDTIKEYKETIDLFGKPRKVTITLKFEPDGKLSVDIIWVEVKCDLFSGTDCLGGCMIEFDSKYDHLVCVKDNGMIDQAIDDYRKDAQKYKDFFGED